MTAVRDTIKSFPWGMTVCLQSNLNPSRQCVYCHFIYKLNTFLLISLNRCKFHFHNCCCIVYIHFPAQKPQLLLFSQLANVVSSLSFEWQVISLLDIKGVQLACLPSTDQSTVHLRHALACKKCWGNLIHELQSILPLRSLSMLNYNNY